MTEEALGTIPQVCVGINVTLGTVALYLLLFILFLDDAGGSGRGGRGGFRGTQTIELSFMWQRIGL